MVANSQKSPKALSFFSGALGLDLGIEQSGFETLLLCETDKACRETISHNRPDTPLLANILDYTSKDILRTAGLSSNSDLDLIIGGPPCQAFSTAGKRQAFQDARGNVLLKYIELALEIRPKFIVLENVRGLLSCPIEHVPHKDRRAAFTKEENLPGSVMMFIKDIIERAGYSFSFNLYNAANFGSPQVRERVVIICSRDGRKVPYLAPTHAGDDSWGLPLWRTFKDVTQDLINIKHDYINFPEKRLRFYRQLESGQNWKNLPKELQIQALGNAYHSGGGKTGFLRRLAWDKPSPTLVTHPAMPATDLAHPKEDRPLSVQEYKRVQEFPDSWEIKGNLLNQYKQIGNAVPASLGKAIGTQLINFAKGNITKNPNNFPFSRYKNTDEDSWESGFLESLHNLQPAPSTQSNLFTETISA